MLSQNQLNRINANYCFGMGDCYAHSSTGMHFDMENTCIFYDTSNQIEYNVVNLKAASNEPTLTIERWEFLFDKLNAPYQVFLAPWFKDEYASYLENRGYYQSGYMRCMVMENLSTISVPIFAGIVTKKVTDTNDFHLFQQIVEESYDYPMGIGAVLPSLMQLSNCELYLAYVDGQAVATSMLYKTDDVAGIYWVGTKKAYRRRGIGQAVTWASIAAGKQKGCALASLQASDLGEPMYKQMGFSTLIPYAKYLRSKTLDHI